MDPTKVRIESIMSEPVITIKEDDFLSEAFYKMLKHQIHRLAVVDDQNGSPGPSQWYRYYEVPDGYRTVLHKRP